MSFHVSPLRPFALAAALFALLFTLDASAQSEGERVLGQWSDGLWYPATITSAEGDAIGLAFDDGDTSTVTLDQVRALDWDVGTRVYCNWKGHGQYFSGTISKKKGEDVHISYDDGDEEDTTLGRCRSETANTPLTASGGSEDASYRASAACKKLVAACESGFCSKEENNPGTREGVYSCYEACLADTDPRCAPIDCFAEGENCDEDFGCSGSKDGDACLNSCFEKRGFTECIE